MHLRVLGRVEKNDMRRRPRDRGGRGHLMRWPVAWFRAWEEGENGNLVQTQVFLVRELL